MQKIKITDFKNKLEKVLVSTYYQPNQAKEIVEVLLFAEMTGKNTQGILKLLGTEPIQNIKPKHEPKIIKETRASTMIDGGGNPAILVCQMANKIAIAKCKKNGFAIIGTHNTFSSSGAIGFYVNEMAKDDFIGIVAAGSPGGVAPFGSLDPLFGTNPIAFGFPTKNDPLIFDMATSAITWYGLVRAKALGQKLPEGVAFDQNGNLTTDPKAAMSGTILPFDKGYKGSGLGMMIEILTGPLVGGTYCNPETGDWSNLFIAIDPDLLAGKEKFKKNCSDLIYKVKSSRKVKSIEEILVPGEKSLRRKREVEKSGFIEVEEKLLDDLEKNSQTS